MRRAELEMVRRRRVLNTANRPQARTAAGRYASGRRCRRWTMPPLVVGQPGDEEVDVGKAAHSAV